MIFVHKQVENRQHSVDDGTVFPRNALASIQQALTDTPVVLVQGPRQTGKTTLVRGMCQNTQGRTFLSLDDALTASAAGTDPTAFLASHDGPIAIDEVQHVPELFRAIKVLVDRNRTPGRFLLTGSANALLLPRLSESLAGRMEIRTLGPLSQGELSSTVESFIDDVFDDRAMAVLLRKDATGEDHAMSPSLTERMLRGGFPEPTQRADADRRRAWFESYLSTVLMRDLRALADIEGLTELPRLLAMLATRVSGLLNFADLSRSLSMPQTTLKRYMALLEATFLVLRLPAWSNNRGVRLTKAPKLFLCDTGLTSFLLGADRKRLDHDGSVRGAMLECFVAMELLKQREWSHLRPVLHHFRTVSGQEVDLVLEDASGRVVGIEVKATHSIKTDDFRGLRALSAICGERMVRGIVLHGGAQSAAFGPNLVALPIPSLWQSKRIG